MRTRVLKWGNSLAVRIPKPVAEQIGLEDRAAVEMSVRNGNLILSPARPEYSLKDLVQGITPRNKHKETDLGRPVGREVL